MREAVISVLMCVMFFFSEGQPIENKSVDIKGRSVQYSFFSETDSPRRILFGFYDIDTTLWNQETFCKELSPFAEKNGYNLIVPQLSNGFELQTFLDLFVSETDYDSVVFIANGSGCRHGVTLIEKGVSGLLINPIDSIEAIKINGIIPVSLISDVSRMPIQKLWLDSLLKEGIWLNHLKVDASHMYYIDNHYEIYDAQLLWIDSMQHFLNDSAAFSNWKEESGIQNTPNEVYRQGSEIELVLKLTRPEIVHIDIMDLSANVVQSSESLFGIGNHSIEIETKNLNWGVYNIEIKGEKLLKRFKIMIRG
jgi:hypothetical protein